MIENPFKYGVVVDEPFFINREKEMAEITLDLVSGANLIITSPRRYGKTSLLVKILNTLEEEGYPVVYIDLFRMADLKQFIDSYSAAMLKKQSGLKKALANFQQWTRGIRPAVSIDPSGSPVFSFTHDPAIPLYESLTDVLNLPLKIPKDKRWIIVMDEFQDIEKFNGKDTEKWFRSVIQFHDKISYVFMGSKTHLLSEIFSQRDRAFYGFGKLIRIEKIPEQEMVRYITDRMITSGIKCNEEMAAEIVAKASNIPYFVQFLASEVWKEAYLGGGLLAAEQLTNAIEHIMDNQQDHFHQLIDQLNPYQKKVLRALSREQQLVYSYDFMKKYDLGAVSSTQRAVDKLINLGILDKEKDTYSFSNPFFLTFLQKRVFK
jgi:AAA+ ATPase superfamily predicted ATPase